MATGDRAARRRGEGRDVRALALALGAVLLAFYAVPLAALLSGRSVGGLRRSLTDPAVLAAAATTLGTALVSTAVALALGVPLAYWLARAEGRARSLGTGLVAFPLVLPPVVGGLLLVSAFGRQGLGGLVGLAPTRTAAGVVLAQVFVASPFVVLAARNAFDGVDRRLEEVAWTQGVSEWRTVRRVTLPLASRGIAAGATLAFARAAGEFGATLVVAYYPRTLPVQVWVAFQGRGLDAAYPVALILVTLAFLTLAVVGVVRGSDWPIRRA